eukprot:TRINITY_DN223_c0_g2_i4.p2 TRINITY_DN223_c0_g2~~TRINITY_DN223_c0_g2_i4.p2  ORF type:complete len:253 (+),score=63.80 TRINITY_DN223_c0_g2_i4:54-812(+)
MRLSAENAHNFYVFFFSSRRRHTRSCLVSWARRCVQETEMSRVIDLILCIISLFISVKAIEPGALKIVHPEDFEVTDEKGTKGNKISFNIGNFGRVPWGQDSTGFAYFSNPEDACSSIELKKIFDDEGYSPFLIARRGGCTFVTKAHFAQIHGFRALIIVDNKDENVDYVEMIDDNSGMGKNLTTQIQILRRRRPFQCSSDSLLSYSHYDFGLGLNCLSQRHSYCLHSSQEPLSIFQPSSLERRWVKNSQKR